MKTTRYETSKKLKELGIQQFPFEYVYDNEGNLHYKEYISYLTGKMSTSHIRAYTLDEILEMLPDYIQDEEIKDELSMIRRYGDYAFYYNAEAASDWTKNPAEAAGQLLLWCIENGYVKPEELNQKEERDV